MGCRMSLKVHMLDFHLEKFKENMGRYSEEQGDRFYQDMLKFEQRYQGQYTERMMGEYIWNVVREIEDEGQRREREKHISNNFLPFMLFTNSAKTF